MRDYAGALKEYIKIGFPDEIEPTDEECQTINFVSNTIDAISSHDPHDILLLLHGMYETMNENGYNVFDYLYPTAKKIEAIMNSANSEIRDYLWHS